MFINKIQEDGKLTLALEGRLDTATSHQLQDALLPALDVARQVELDFSKLDYVSSAGLRVLLLGQKTAKEKGALMVLVSVSEEIMEVFEMTRFIDILTIR